MARPPEQPIVDAEEFLRAKAKANSLQPHSVVRWQTLGSDLKLRKHTTLLATRVNGDVFTSTVTDI